MADFPKTRRNQRNAAGIRDAQEQTVADLIEIVGIGARGCARSNWVAADAADRLLQCSENIRRDAHLLAAAEGRGGRQDIIKISIL